MAAGVTNAPVATPDIDGNAIDCEASKEIGKEYLATEHRFHILKAYADSITQWNCVLDLPKECVVPATNTLPTKYVVMQVASTMIPFVNAGRTFEDAARLAAVRLIGLSAKDACGGFTPLEAVVHDININDTARLEAAIVGMTQIPGKTTAEVTDIYRRCLMFLTTGNYEAFKELVKNLKSLAQSWKLVISVSVICFLRLGHHCRTEEANRRPFVDLCSAVFKAMTEEEMYKKLKLNEIEIQHDTIRLGTHFLCLSGRVKLAIETYFTIATFKGAKLRIQGAGFEYSAMAIVCNFATEILDLIVDPKNNSKLIPQDIFEAAMWFHEQRCIDFSTIDEYFKGPGALSGVTSMIGGKPEGAGHLAACKSYLTKNQRLCLGILYTSSTSWKQSIVLSKGLTSSEIREIEDRYTAYRAALPTNPDGRLAAMSAVFKDMDKEEKKMAAGANALIVALTGASGATGSKHDASSG